MSKISNKNRKKHYDNYKMGGHYDTNKRLKQTRHEKRMARFAKRKEEGKTYVYSKERAKAKREEAYENGVILGTNVGGNRGRDTEVAKTTSIFRKLRNQLEAEVAKEKEKLLSGKGKEKVA